LIDVRSETEFVQSGVPGFVSRPLLYQEERKLVGLCYKSHGQDAAIKLGHELVDPYRAERVAGWMAEIANSKSQMGLVMCWRGGLRSQIATQWIREAGGTAQQWEGGYKQLRQHFLTVLNQPPPLLVLGGWTGSGKTELLREFPTRSVDLEALAQHKGSAFGGLLGPQPSQTRFENSVALGLFKSLVLLEDEGRLIGKRSIPSPLYQAMQRAPLIILESPLEERVERIYGEYVTEPLSQGLDYTQLESYLLASLDKLRRRLDRAYPLLRDYLKKAFTEEPALAHHAPWIEGLLTQYYDPTYLFAAKRHPRPPALQGDLKTCRLWLQERFKNLC
jgi:tRNA 2-selenouridine synthase